MEEGGNKMKEFDMTAYAKARFLNMAKEKIESVQDFGEFVKCVDTVASEGRSLEYQLEKIERTFSWLEDLGDEDDA